MKYYVGETFEEAKRTAKEYKSLLYAKNKADNTGMMVFDENGTKVHPLKVELTDDVPDGALDENEDGTLKVYDEDGNIVGSMTKEEAEQISNAITDQDIEAAIVAANTTEEVHGKLEGYLTENFVSDADLPPMMTRSVALLCLTKKQ